MLVYLHHPRARGCHPVCRCVNGDTIPLLLSLSSRYISHQWITQFRMIAYTVPVQDSAILCAHCLLHPQTRFLPSFFYILMSLVGEEAVWLRQTSVQT